MSNTWQNDNLQSVGTLPTRYKGLVPKDDDETRLLRYGLGQICSVLDVCQLINIRRPLFLQESKFSQAHGFRVCYCDHYQGIH